MFLELFEEKDFDLLSSWIVSKEECLLWAGPTLFWPLKKEEFFINDDKNSFKYILKLKNEKLGFIELVKTSEHKIRFCKIFIHKNFRSKSYGKKLISLAMQKSKKEFNINNFDLNVFIDNISAIKCYENVGFNIQNKYNFIDKKDNKEYSLYKMSKISS